MGGRVGTRHLDDARRDPGCLVVSEQDLHVRSGGDQAGARLVERRFELQRRRIFERQQRSPRGGHPARFHAPRCHGAIEGRCQHGVGAHHARGIGPRASGIACRCSRRRCGTGARQSRLGGAQSGRGLVELLRRSGSALQQGADPGEGSRRKLLLGGGGGDAGLCRAHGVFSGAQRRCGGVGAGRQLAPVEDHEHLTLPHTIAGADLHFRDRREHAAGDVG